MIFRSMDMARTVMDGVLGWSGFNGLGHGAAAIYSGPHLGNWHHLRLGGGMVPANCSTFGPIQTQ